MQENGKEMSQPQLIQKKLNNISQMQKERLFYIDFKRRFLGTVNRNNLGIKASAATRDISLYKEIAPKNLIYDSSAKSYTQADTFKPVFNHGGQQALPALYHGLGDDHVEINNGLIVAEAPIQLNFPKLGTLAAVTKSIHQKKALKIECRPLSSGRTTREISLFVLVDNDLLIKHEKQVTSGTVS